MLRGFITVPSCSSRNGGVAAAALFATTNIVSSSRTCMQTAKGRSTMRLDYSHSMKRGAEALRDIKERENIEANPSPKNKKEALAHLTSMRPDYEYTTDFQRAADDMLAVQSDPRKFVDDMSYHYHRVGKSFNGSTTWANEGNSSCGQFNKLQPPN